MDNCYSTDTCAFHSAVGLLRRVVFVHPKKVWVEEEMGAYRDVNHHTLENAVGEEVGGMQ